ncbi:hypothetical protein [Shewanella sp. KCT]|uniref:hypothetical protein n=1 Tax=Shewanella sp. KCT TaxID=2569535 RepID=UPI001182C1A2|nr:hypothetical protein [Shewanella sp. KCT]TVP12190.1 hypothetical protein AYI87_14205 [Shewanella sp. KCT]
MKTRIISLQFAYFLRDIVSRPDLEFSTLNSEMLNIFDAMPQMIPVPRELPVELPVMILSSERKEYTCNISRSRIDFILQRTNDEKSNIDLLKDFNSKVAGLTKAITSKQEVIRFGMVARYFHQDNTAVRTLRNKFFSGAADGAEELSLRFNKISESFGYKINDIHEINAAEAVTDGRVEKGIFIQRDINNTPIQGKHLDFETLLKISQKYAPRISESEIEALIK